MTIPCSWSEVVCEACPGWADYSDGIKSTALWLASTYLWAATGRQYGTCPVTVRPAQAKFCGSPEGYRAYPVWPGAEPAPTPIPYLFGGTWHNTGCGSGCCGRVDCSIVLDGPVASVIEVLVGGELIEDTDYRVDVVAGEYHLVRLGEACWPTCQDFSVEGDAAGAFEVTYGRGREIPEVLAIATSKLACEHAKFITGGACVLPAKMTRLSRQGVEVEVAAPDPAQGSTGIRWIDDVVYALNPSRRQRPPIMLSPDMPGIYDRMTVVPAGGS